MPAESVSSFDVAILVSEDSLISVEDSLASGRRSEIGKECALLLEFCCEGGLAFDDVSPSDFFSS
jgi:hypothetical protein